MPTTVLMWISISFSTEGIGIARMRDIGIAQQATVAPGFTSRVRHLSYSAYLLITGSSQEGRDTSPMANYTGIGELGKEEDIGSTITGEDRNTKDITD